MMVYYETNRQVIHLAQAKRCSDQADYLSCGNHSLTGPAVINGRDSPSGPAVPRDPHAWLLTSKPVALTPHQLDLFLMFSNS